MLSREFIDEHLVRLIMDVMEESHGQSIARTCVSCGRSVSGYKKRCIDCHKLAVKEIIAQSHQRRAAGKARSYQKRPKEDSSTS
jgi:hypothetical protein